MMVVYNSGGRSRDLHLQKTNITTIPNDLHVDGNLHLRDAKVSSLPDDFEVGRNLDLYGLDISELPKNLRVGGIPDLHNPKITRLRDDFTCSELLLDVENIENVVAKPEREIYAIYTNNKYKIVLREFYGSIEDLKECIDDTLSLYANNALKEIANETINAANDCVVELKTKLNHVDVDSKARKNTSCDNST
jgi:hypothetical protein